MMPQSPSKQASWDLTQFSQSPSAAASCFPESHQQSATSSLPKVILVLGKPRSHRVPNLAYRVTESPGLLMFRRKTAWNVMHEWEHYCDDGAHHQLPRAAAFWLLNSFCRGMFKLNAKFDADSLLYLLSHFECDGHTVHMLPQTPSIAPTD